MAHDQILLSSGREAFLDVWKWDGGSSLVHVSSVWGEKLQSCFSILPLSSGHVACGAQNGRIAILEVQPGGHVSLHTTLKVHSSLVMALAEIPGGVLASGSMDHTIALIGMGGEWPILHALKGHDNDVLALTALPGGRLASGGEDHTIHFWDVSEVAEGGGRAPPGLFRPALRTVHPTPTTF